MWEKHFERLDESGIWKNRAMILITGAAGKTGRAVIQRLVDTGQAVRALARRPDQVIWLEKLGVQEVMVGDMGDQAVMDQAVRGVGAVYHICPNMHPEEIRIGEIVLHAAQSAAVERFVYHSVLHPQIEAMAHHWQKLRVEEKLLESGLSFSILQPAAYMQNVLANWDRINNEGIYAIPYAVDTRVSMVDLQDIAEVAAKTLVETGHAGAIYELCGPDVLSQRDVAAALEMVLGRPVRAEAVPIETWEQGARDAGLSDYALETLSKMFLHYEAFDFWGSPRVLGWLLGRSPTSFNQFLERTIHEME
jgi:NAD(P)H dehydrogenase (quinone)